MRIYLKEPLSILSHAVGCPTLALTFSQCSGLSWTAGGGGCFDDEVKLFVLGFGGGNGNGGAGGGIGCFEDEVKVLVLGCDGGNGGDGGCFDDEVKLLVLGCDGGNGNDGEGGVGGGDLDDF